jgi:hypothetical protein
MSLAHNIETVALLLPHLSSLSGLPGPLKRYEPQIRAALEALNYDQRSLVGVAATLRDAYAFLQWHRECLTHGFKTDCTGVLHGGLRRDE